MTIRVAAELEAEEALAYAENIIATLRQPFLVLDASLNVRTANAAFLKTFQVTKEETEGRFLYDFGNRQWDIPALRTLLEEVLPRNHSFQDYSVEHDFPSIGRKIMLLNARKFEPGDARRELILLAIEDVTDRTQAGVALKDSETRYRRLFETAKDGILILDALSGDILDANPFMSELLGLSHAEFLGKSLWEIGLFSDRSDNEAAFRMLQVDGYVRYEHLPLKTKIGSPVEVEFVSNVYRVDGRLVAQCNIRDISDRTRLERHLVEQAEELASLDRRKDEFLAMLSHELRNPLAAMTNAVQLLRLQQASENPIQRQSRTILERQLGQLKQLVNDLLEVSRITTGSVRLRLERVALQGIVESAVETVRPLLDQHRHDLILTLPSEPLWLLADAARLEQVLVNLLTNAAKYTDDHGHITLAVDAEAGMCVVRVRDDGVGIAPELLPRVFDLFTQADRLLDRSEGGLGIGLCLVQRLVELHGGSVIATSVVGAGSEFVVRLPIADPATLLPLPPAASLESSPGRLQVVVVDDNVDMALSLAMLVKAAGHDVRVFHDGPSSLQGVVDYRPDVVLLDIGLPGMDGHEVARRIRQLPDFQSVELVALTGYGQDSDRKTSLEAGFNHHLTKPADFKDVLAILTSVSRAR